MKQNFANGDIVCLRKILVPGDKWWPGLAKIADKQGKVVATRDGRVDVYFDEDLKSFWLSNDWLEFIGTTYPFKIGDRVIVTSGHPKTEAFKGEKGEVIRMCERDMVLVAFETRYWPTQVLIPALCLDIVPTTNTKKETMTTQSATATATATVKETFTTTWSLDITLTDGKVTAVNVHPPAEPKPEPKKPKFKVGDIVVCKTRPQKFPSGITWSYHMTDLLNVPGRVAVVNEWVHVEFPGQQGTWGYPEDCLEHEESNMTTCARLIFSRLDEAKKTICIGRSDAKFI